MAFHRHVFGCLLLFVSIFPSTAIAQEFIDDLNGFRLWQYKSAAESYFGKPYDKFERGESVFEAYGVTEKSYMVFETWKKFSHNIYAIQITGYPTKMSDFKGLVLGDPVKKVELMLGKPSKIKKIEKPPVTLYSYGTANYSVEIDADDRLYSIQIRVSNEFMKADLEFKQWDAFKKAVLAKDMKAILELVRPDVEIYKDGKILDIRKRYKDFLAKPDDDFVEALVGENNSVLEELRKTEPEGEMRLTVNIGLGQVYKFYNGKILKEITFFPYNGKYCVYEIAFRTDEDKKEGKTK